MKAKLSLCSFILCFLLAVSGQAQQALINKMIPQPVPKSPNSAAIDKYGDYQVSHYTGLPAISIPLFEAKSGPLSFPVTLNYHAAGHRPMDIASWVGLGWSLNGSQVTRSVNGTPDEYHYFTHPLNPSPSNCTSFYYLKGLAEGGADAEPDIYSYSYPGGGGKFMFVNTGTYVNISTTAPRGPAYLFPYAPIVVSRISDLKLEIKDEKGVTYRFGQNYAGTQASTEATNALNGGNPSLTAITSWNLMTMAAPNSSDSITFNYQALGTANRTDVTHTWLVTDQRNITTGGTAPPDTHNAIYTTSTTSSSVDQKALKEIFFDNGKIEFIVSAAARTDGTQLKFLEKIVVSELFNGVYTTKKTIDFIYSYFTKSGGTNAQLKLDEVQIQDNTGANVQRYTFTYHTNSFSWSPTSFQNARDLWGFFNGATGNTDLVLRRSVPFQYSNVTAPGSVPIGGGVNRSVNPAYSKEGVLQRINFPTGGYTEFDYENHKYLNDDDVVTLAGGLRVTKITSKDSPNGISLIKTYKYGIAESGVGKALFSSNQLNYQGEQLVYAPYCDGVNPPSVRYRIRSYHSTFFNVEESSPVVYLQVTEYDGDYAGTTNGKTEYEYDGGQLIVRDMEQVVPPSTKSFRHSNAWQRGKLSKKTIYVGAAKVQKETTQYNTFHATEGKLVGIGTYTFKTGAFQCAEGPFCPNELNEPVDQNLYRSALYFQNSGVLLPTVTTRVVYGTASDSVAVTSTSAYDPDKLVVLENTETRSNTAQETVVVNRYPFQFAANVNATSTGNAKGIYMLNSKNVLGTPMETYTYLQGSGTTQRVTSAVLSTFRQNANNAKHVVADQVFLFESAQPLAKISFVPMTVNGTGVSKDSRYALRLNFSEYNTNSQVTQFAKANDIANSFQYGYGSKLPVAEIKNAAANEFKLEGFEDSSVAGVVTDLTQAQTQTGRKYFNGDYTISFTRPNSRDYVVEYYYFSSPNWVFISKPYTGTSMALTEGTRIDNIRIRPVDAPLTSYTYDPLYGISSITDPNCVTTYYGYDTFGRLQIVKDHKNSAVSTYNYHYYKQ
ncbi:MAG TPA: hypothetical protein VK658_01020 [Chryseolinea sp.]|nr:hypothetical protein [Chryseolinea sp.]